MSEKFISIAIDGPVAAGKTTQAKLLAKELGFLYVDTGAMYRTIAVFMTWFPTLAPSMEKVLAGINMKLKRGQDGEQRMFLGTEDVTDQLRTPKISKLASNISALPCVRDFLLGMQRKAAEENDVVMEGRDIGTVILPDATVKIFLTADADMRAFRRWRELKQKGQTENFYNVMGPEGQGLQRLTPGSGAAETGGGCYPAGLHRAEQPGDDSGPVGDRA